MKALTPYLIFSGNCREAMNFYKNCFGGNLEMHTFGEAPAEAQPSGANAGDMIMHATLTSTDMVLMASDNPMSSPRPGDNISISINLSSVQETQKIFNALVDGGKVTMPLANTFWNAYFGMLVDKYGFHWMLNCQLDE